MTSKQIGKGVTLFVLPHYIDMVKWVDDALRDQFTFGYCNYIDSMPATDMLNHMISKYYKFDTLVITVKYDEVDTFEKSMRFVEFCKESMEYNHRIIILYQLGEVDIFKLISSSLSIIDPAINDEDYSYNFNHLKLLLAIAYYCTTIITVDESTMTIVKDNNLLCGTKIDCISPLIELIKN